MTRRITAAWCKKHDVPIEKLFSKTLLTKCTSSHLFLYDLVLITSTVPWALEVDEDWKF